MIELIDDLLDQKRLNPWSLYHCILAQKKPVAETLARELLRLPFLDRRILKPDWVPSPLTDAAFTAMHPNAEAAGLAMESLANAVLLDVNGKPTGKVLSLDAQHVHSSIGQRGYRTDVQAETDKGEVLIFESQLRPFTQMDRRSVVYCQMRLTDRTAPGGSLEDVLAGLPRVVMINLLGFEWKNGRIGAHQVVKPAYCGTPFTPLEGLFEVHHLQIRKFRRTRPDYRNPLHCWMVTLYRADRDSRLMSETVANDPNLKNFLKADEG
ncbi:MAG: Rpn family recombination-promoting nuclease/putative transposase, partial [Deltaproteobacteria bacterium]|nr:Rpn family recombination-promoting nuclease/putative transposase [Deltaproteobacteria bacterium]